MLPCIKNLLRTHTYTTLVIYRRVGLKNVHHHWIIYSTYRESPHKTVKWETEYIVLCEIVLFQIENRDIAKTVLCETLLRTMRGIEIFQNQSYREISPMWGSLMRGLPVSLFRHKIFMVYKMFQNLPYFWNTKTGKIRQIGKF